MTCSHLPPGATLQSPSLPHALCTADEVQKLPITSQVSCAQIRSLAPQRALRTAVQSASVLQRDSACG